ncbi:hypothetical protein OAO87_04270 [bacterium]|nr:hypothetical protein [bacterium]
MGRKAASLLLWHEDSGRCRPATAQRHLPLPSHFRLCFACLDRFACLARLARFARIASRRLDG